MSLLRQCASAGQPRSGLDVVLRAIGEEVVNGRAQPIDILALQEVQSQQTTTQAVVTLLNGIYGDGTSARGNVDGTVLPGSGTQGIVFCSSSVQLVDGDQITVPGFGRQAMRYEFWPQVAGAGADSCLCNSHFSSDDAAARLSEANTIRVGADEAWRTRKLPAGVPGIGEAGPASPHWRPEDLLPHCSYRRQETEPDSPRSCSVGRVGAPRNHKAPCPSRSCRPAEEGTSAPAGRP
jgi:hypothetical protein